MNTNETHDATTTDTRSRAEQRDRAAEAIVDSLLEIGAVWARHGLGVGRSALQASARTLERTAEALGELARTLDRTAADAHAASVARRDAQPDSAAPDTGRTDEAPATHD